MKRQVTGMFIFDDKIRERFPEKAEQIIAALEADPRTQKGKATRPAEARYRPAVEAWLAAIPKDEPRADEARRMPINEQPMGKLKYRNLK
jgi:hypothetical protein